MCWGFPDKPRGGGVDRDGAVDRASASSNDEGAGAASEDNDPVVADETNADSILDGAMIHVPGAPTDTCIELRPHVIRHLTDTDAAMWESNVPDMFLAVFLHCLASNSKGSLIPHTVSLYNGLLTLTLMKELTAQVKVFMVVLYDDHYAGFIFERKEDGNFLATVHDAYGKWLHNSTLIDSVINKFIRNVWGYAQFDIVRPSKRRMRLKKVNKKSVKESVRPCCTVDHLTITTDQEVEGNQHCCPLIIERLYWELKGENRFQSGDYFDVAVHEMENSMPRCDPPYNKCSRRVLRILVRMIMNQEMLRESTVTGGLSWLDRDRSEKRTSVTRSVLGRRSICETVYKTDPATFAAKFQIGQHELSCKCGRIRFVHSLTNTPPT